MNELTSPSVPLRSSRQRYDRPAQSVTELLHAPAQEFPFIAYWTMFGRAILPDELAAAYEAIAEQKDRLAWLADLSQTDEGRAQPIILPDLASILSDQRRERWPLIGPTINRWLGWSRRQLWIKQLLWPSKRLAGLLRYSYRHSRKRLKHFSKYVGIRLPHPIRQSSTAALAAEMNPSERAIFEQLTARRYHYLRGSREISG